MTSLRVMVNNLKISKIRTKNSKMKKRTLFLTILTLFVGFSFAQKQFAYQVECVSVEHNGFITIKIWNTKLGKRYKQEQARKDAIHAFLFSGVPANNGCIAQKPMLSNAESIENFKNIEKDFFAKNGIWSNYTREATIENALPDNIGDKSWKVYQVSVSKDLLRKYLEDQKIIKSLNSGF